MAVDLGYDESGEGDGDILVVSMQLGLTERVWRMNKLWKKELAKANVPFFHSKDYDNYTGGIFRDLPKRRRKPSGVTFDPAIRGHLKSGHGARRQTTIWERCSLVLESHLTWKSPSFFNPKR